MVRRIIPDSDFESDDDSPQITVVSSSSAEPRNLRASPSCPINSHRPPSSTRRIVRPKSPSPELRDTYDYDSDIYTEESSMGSFIVYTDDKQDEQIVDKTSSVSIFYS